VRARCIVIGQMCCSIKRKDMDLALECVAMVTAALPCCAGLQAWSPPADLRRCGGAQGGHGGQSVGVFDDWRLLPVAPARGWGCFLMR